MQNSYRQIIGVLCIIFSLEMQAQVSDIDLPVLNISTVNNEMPTCDIVNAPEGCIGTSITNNNYVPGRMTMTLKDETLYDSGDYEKSVSGMRIKIRGNSTGAFLNQHPYKIKLSKKYDLLQRNDASYKHKEWLLLSMYVWNPAVTNEESNILNMVGVIVSNILHKEWTPDYQLVNVMLNGEYQGMYYLMECVSRGDQRIQTAANGFIIEYDPFWWNEDKYFKTDHQRYPYGYTYKYPDSDDVTEETISEHQNYMNEVENAIYSHQDIEKYIDMESFAKWMLIHDMLASVDLAGCNKYLVRYDNSSLLAMGPAWDFDSSFRAEGWCGFHTFNDFYFAELFQMKAFTDIYVNLWKEIRPTILSRIQEEFDKVWNKYGEVFDASMAIHKTKYTNEGKTNFKTQIDEAVNKLNERVSVIDELMQEYEEASNITDTKKGCHFTANTFVDLQGRYTTTPTNTSIIVTNGKKYVVRKK